MKAIEALGRILFALIFIAAAPRHFTAAAVAHAAELGTPAAALLVPLSGAMAMLGGLSVALGYRTRVGACLLVGFLLPVTVIMHSFWLQEAGRDFAVQQAMFAKNVSMIGAALLLFVHGSGAWSLDRHLARRALQGDRDREQAEV